MLECYLATYADIGWALQSVKAGQSVHVQVPKPLGTRTHREQQASLADRLVGLAQESGARVSGFEYQTHGRLRRRQCLGGFVISPAPTEGTAGVREPRHPRPNPPTTAAELELPRH